jgi:hypothetical protein
MRLLIFLAVALLLSSCSASIGTLRPTWGEVSAGRRSHFNQSCGAACAAPVNVSTGEFFAPAASRTGSAWVEGVTQAVETTQGLLTVQRLLTEAELSEVEEVVRKCVAQAHADVNESYQRESGNRFGNGMFPSDSECNQEVGVDDRGRPITLAQKLGVLKHAAAFACIKARLPEDLRGSFSIEPRYKGVPEINGTVLTNNKLGSLVPDVVVHAMRNATDVQCVYEIKFPCHERIRLAPMSEDTKAQLESHAGLAVKCRVSLVTPTGVYPYEGEP